ncbi:ABC transporter permease [Fulvivirgaceae bacterium BMA10]|uniref:Transport permease protein n=1 Tax=Splendidivirga corallicola TaxID=3051826 RepID=A0ABT8KQU4_9BACT|nr:ABC transporter permease [Fulvivirgaceae bacterium BMA10]
MAVRSIQGAENQEWSLVIKPKTNWLSLNLKDLWRYRDLLFLFVRRDFVAVYKQTILGPAWFFIQPILTTVMYMVVFGGIAKLSTDGMPQSLFYMSGVTAWSYFADCINKTSKTFTSNAAIFGKVYFPRLIMPLSIIVSNLIKFGIQFLLFMGFLVFFLVKGSDVNPNFYIFLMPVLILMMACLGLGLGLIISSLTTKYRDLTHLVTFGVQLFMYATPVVYPLSALSDKNELIQKIVMLNPLTPIVEAFRYSFLGAGTVSPIDLVISGVTILFILIIGIIVFNRIEKNFMDTV